MRSCHDPLSPVLQLNVEPYLNRATPTASALLPYFEAAVVGYPSRRVPHDGRWVFVDVISTEPASFPYMDQVKS